MRTLSLFRSFTCITSLLSAVCAFSVTVGAPTQCDDLTVSWIGGQAPFEILLTPVFMVPQNISVPPSAFSNDKGSYSISQLPFSNGTQFLLTMSDATSFGSGGTTTILTVGNPVAKNNCNTTGPSLDFSFGLPSALQQCSGYTFNEYDDAVQPITIMALIPGGESLVLYPPVGSSFTWVADVRAGTNLVFVMIDSEGRQGGSSDIETVSLSNDASCLNANSPSSTLSVLPSTIPNIATPTSSGSSPTSSQSTSSGSNVATIAGTAIGCMVAIAAFTTLGIFLWRQRRASHSAYAMSSSKRHSRRLPSVDLDHGVNHIPAIQPFPYQADSVRHLTPPSQFATQSHRNITPTGNYAVSDRPRLSHTRQDSNNESSVGNGAAEGSFMTSIGSRKAAMAGQSTYKNATRFILHTDVDDVLPDENGVVELPPQYSEHRQPQPPALQPEPAQRPVSSHSEYSGPSELAYTGTVFVSSPWQSQSHLHDAD